MKSQLIDVLNRAGQPTTLERLPDGSEALVLAHGCRLLGLFAPGSEENFFWTHPALDAVESAVAFYASDQWHNSGGGRTWLAPEVDFFLPNYPKTDVYFQPREFDPGRWQPMEGDARRWFNLSRHRLTRSGVEVEVALSKSIGPAANPLRHDESALDVEYAGYRQATLLTLRGPAGVAVGLWDLLQLPHGGDLIVPTYSSCRPRTFFGHVADDDLEVGPRRTRWRMRATGEHKIGFRAAAVTGRAGYRRQARDGRAALVVCNGAVWPSGAYVDVPWDAPDDVGYALQACNVSSALGNFSEVERHAPAAIAGPSGGHGDDALEVWAFRGDAATIDRVENALLGT